MQFTRNRAGEQILDVQEDKQTVNILLFFSYSSCFRSRPRVANIAVIAKEMTTGLQTALTRKCMLSMKSRRIQTRRLLLQVDQENILHLVCEEEIVPQTGGLVFFSTFAFWLCSNIFWKIYEILGLMKIPVVSLICPRSWKRPNYARCSRQSVVFP